MSQFRGLRSGFLLAPFCNGTSVVVVVAVGVSGLFVEGVSLTVALGSY